MMSGRTSGAPVVVWTSHMVRASSVALVAANLVIAVMALFQEWGYYQALWIFWCEMVIIGVFNLVRMVIVGFAGSPLGSLISPDNWAGRILVVVVLGGFFIAKFGGAVLGIGVLLLVLPYMRITLMMVVLVVGLVVAAHVPGLSHASVFTAVVILLKLMADLFSHVIEHRSS